MCLSILPFSTFLFFLLFFSAALGHEDEISWLPGLDFVPNFKHYSGFLQTIDSYHFHYWFITSQHNPDSDPLVFWFNGGPGCSSLDGLLNEMGPYQVNSDGRTLRRNPNSWNKNASVVYIESPAGVGFSYSSDGRPGVPSDDSTSEENYAALKQFFRKFPAFRTRRVFIVGESYAGVYVPTLVERILDGQREFPINLEGMAIGNGLVSWALNADTLVRFAYGHGLVGEDVWQELERECCGGCADSCDLSTQRGECGRQVVNIVNFCWNGGLNVYDLYRSCDSDSALNSVKMNAIKRGILRAKSLLSNETALWQFSLGKEPMGESERRHHGTRYLSDVPCIDDSPITHYLNMPQVRKALHIPELVPAWEVCNDWTNMVYHMQYADVSPLIKKALARKLRVLLYYGDTDMACNFLMGQNFAARLGISTVEKKKPWKFEGQIAGFKTVYEKSLTFITVRGAGHMVPQWRAPQMDYAFRQFLSNQPI